MGKPKDGGVIIYANIADHINEKTYLIESPQYYADVPREVEAGDWLATFENPDPHAMGRSRYSISAMIDMRSKNVPFVIINTKDIMDIKIHLDLYLVELHTRRGNPEVDAYLRKCATFQKEITKSFHRHRRNSGKLKELQKHRNLFEQVLDGDGIASSIADEYIQLMAEEVKAAKVAQEASDASAH